MAARKSGGGSLRITGGSLRGRKIAVPEGEGVRPTSDRARETLFNLLTNRFKTPSGTPVLVEALVLDAFAGTGALGLEALSRGAKFSAFCENQATHAGVLKANLQTLSIEPERFSVSHRPEARRGPFDVVFADPPYAKGQALVAALCAQEPLFTPETLLIWERDLGVYEPIAGWREIHATTVGRTEFSFQVPENASQW